MAQLDVSEVFDDDVLQDSFAVKRREQVVDNDGYASNNVTDDEGFGVVCMASPNDLLRLPEEQRTTKTLSIVTRYPLRATAPDVSPDLVGWQGSFFVVVNVEPYTHFGAGFVQALCSSQNYQDAAPAMPVTDEPPAPGPEDAQIDG